MKKTRPKSTIKSQIIRSQLVQHLREVAQQRRKPQSSSARRKP